MFEIAGELKGGHRQDHTTVLAEAVRGYPMGIGLVKEFLQNADDAGATELRVVYDRRRHPGPCSPVVSGAALDVVLGPALLFINDSVFSDDDLTGIRNIGKSVKFSRASGTGRFGKGFCTAFSVSDHPTILTGASVMWFDPHHHAICSRDHTSTETNMRRFDLKAASEHFPNWMRTFAVPTVTIEPESCSSTVFRLPLRNEATAPLSEISHQVLTDDVWQNIVATARQLGPALLVFLRSLDSLKLSEIDEHGAEHAKLEIVTENALHVRNARAPLHAATDGDTVPLLEAWMDGSADLPIAVYEHEFIVTDGGADLHEERWTVVSGLVPGPENCLLSHAHQVCTAEDPDKVLPWAGAAVCLATTRENALLGGRSCFLPIGDQSHTTPVWIHGWFDLDVNRSHLTRDFGGVGNASNRALWNQRLLEHGVGPLWARLIERLAERPHAEPRGGYRLWAEPPEGLASLEAALSLGFYGAATELAVMRARSGGDHEMCLPSDRMRYLPNTVKPALEAGLVEDDVPFYDPRPSKMVRRGLAAVDIEVKPLTPHDLRVHFDEMGLLGATADCWSLEHAPSALLRGRDRLDAIWAFFALSDTAPTDLAEAPLCLTLESRLRCFDEDALIYTCTTEQAEILQTLPHRRLHPACQSALNLEEREDRLGVSPIHISDLPEFLEALRRRDGDITDDWAACVLDDLVRRTTKELGSEFDTLHKLPLLPNLVGNRTPLGYWQTAALATDSVSQPLDALLKRLCVPIVCGSSRLHSAVAAALEHYPRMMNALTPRFVAKVLSDGHADWCHPPTRAQRLAALGTQDVSTLLDYLAQVKWDVEDAADSKLLSELRQRLRLITSQGMLVPADAANVYRPTGALPPAALEAGVTLLDVSGQGWADLFSALGVEPLDGATLMIHHGLPFLCGPAADAAKHEVRLWILRQAPAVLGELAERSSGAGYIRSALRTSPLLPLQNGRTGSAHTAYRADTEEGLERLAKVLGPDVSVVPWEPPDGLTHTQWYTVLAVLAVPRIPRASDVLDAILDVAEDWPDDPELRGRALGRLRGTYAYLNEDEPNRLKSLSEEVLTAAVVTRAIFAIGNACSGVQGVAHMAKLQSHWRSTPPRLMAVLRALRWLPAQPRMWADEEDDFAPRLFAPTELYPPRQRQRVSAVRPVLAFAEPIKEFREFLGLQSAGSIEMEEAKTFGPIGEQLCALLRQDPGHIDEARLDEFKKTVGAVFTQLASLSDPKAALDEWDWPCSTDSQGPSEVAVLVDRAWRYPNTVFFNSMALAPNPWIGPLTGWESRELSLQRPFLQAVGVRDVPEPADWVRMLSGLREIAGDSPLGRGHLGLANRALRALATELRDGSVEQCGTTFVLSDVDGLIDATESYEIDSSRLQPHRDRLDLPVIKREEDNRRVARWAGVQPISEVVSLGNPQGTVVEGYFEPDRAKALLQLVAQHPDIWAGLVARLRYHYAVKSIEGIDIELGTVRRWQEQAVQLAADLKITVYSTLSIELSFETVDHEALSLEERYFVDYEQAAVHILREELDYSLEEALAALALGGDISRAEAAEAGKTLLRVARDPREAKAILDRLDIVCPPDETSDEQDACEVGEVSFGQWSDDHSAADGESDATGGALQESLEEGSSEAGLGSASTVGTDSAALQVPAVDEVDDNEMSDESDGSLVDGSARRRGAPRDHQHEAGPSLSVVKAADSATTPGEGALGAASSGEGGSRAVAPAAPRANGGAESGSIHGTTHRSKGGQRKFRPKKSGKGRQWRGPADRKQATDDRSSDTTSRQSRSQHRTRDRMTSYVTREGTIQEGRHLDRQEWERTADTGKLGEAAVLEYERRTGRCAVQIGGNNPGYDIASSPTEGEDGPDMDHPDARYIEVKATRHAWDAYGVAISEAQFEMAQDPDYRARWWLYVVECVDSADQRIHEVPNPLADSGLQFRFDGGWAKWAERERARSTATDTPVRPVPCVGERFRQRHPSGRTFDFTVIRVVRDVASKRVSAQVQLDSGEKRTMQNLDGWEPIG